MVALAEQLSLEPSEGRFSAAQTHHKWEILSLCDFADGLFCWCKSQIHDFICYNNLVYKDLKR